ncbi:MAG: hypothetical protein ACAH95_13130 [Fimbriimonas sp.]
MLGVLLATLAIAADSQFDKAIAALTQPEAVTVTYSIRNLTGDKSNWTLKMMRPNLLVAESESKLIIADGTDITELTKASKTYTKEPQTEEFLETLRSKPELILGRLYFERGAEWLGKQKAAPGRSRAGVALTGTLLTLPSGANATFYTPPTDPVIALIQIEPPKGITTDTFLIDKIELATAPPAKAEFQVQMPAGARPADAPVAELSPAAKEDLAKGLIPYHQLTWKDYKVVDSNDNKTAIYMGTYLLYSFKSKAAKSGAQYQATIAEIEIRSGLDSNKTWRSAKFPVEADRLLQHEQGHLDINEAGANGLRRAFKTKPPIGYGATADAAADDLRSKIKQMLSESGDKTKALDAEYERATDLGRNESQQIAWNGKIAILMKGLDR